MKKISILLAVSVIQIGAVYAGTPVINDRQENQERRIDQGIASGELNKREAKHLEQQQDHIDNMENRAKSDGVVTKGERAKIKNEQDKASARIGKQKHDRQDHN